MRVELDSRSHRNEQSSAGYSHFSAGNQYVPAHQNNFERRTFAQQIRSPGSQHVDLFLLPDHSSSTVPRANKAVTLQQQFENLKRKIKEVETKNERILQKIHITQEQERKRSLERKVPTFIQWPDKADIQPLEGKRNPASSRQKSDHRRDANIPKSRSRMATQLIPPMRNQQISRAFSRQSREIARSMADQPKEQRQQNISQFRQSIQSLEQMNGQLSSQLQQQKMQKQLINSQLFLMEEKLKKESLRLETVKGSFNRFYDLTKQLFQHQTDKLMDIFLNKLLQIDKLNRKNAEKLTELARKTRKCREANKWSMMIKGKSIQVDALPDVSEVLSSQLRTQSLDNMSKKYEHIIKTKNEEYQALMGRLKAKDREFNEMKFLFDKVKEEKRRSDSEKEQRILSLQSVISNLKNENNAVKAELHKFIEQPQDTSRSSISNTEKIDIVDLNNKIIHYDKLLADKNRLVVSLEKELLASRNQISQLFKQYQQNLERARDTFRKKNEELSDVVEALRGEVRKKDQHLLSLQEAQQKMQQKMLQLQLNYENLKDQTSEICTLSKDNILMEQKSHETDLLRSHQSIEQQGSVNYLTKLKGKSVEAKQPALTSILTSEYQLMLDKIQQLSSANRQMQVQNIKDKAEASMSASYKKELERLDQENRNLSNKVQELIDQNSQLQRLYRQPSEMNISYTSTVKSSRLRRDASVGELQDEKRLCQLEDENIKLNSQLLAVQKQLDLTTRISQDQQLKIAQLKQYSSKIEKTNEDLQEIMKNLENKIRKSEENKQHRAQKQNKESKDSEQRLKLQAKIKDLQNDLKKSYRQQKQVNEEGELRIRQIRSQLQATALELLQSQEYCKLQADKILDLQHELQLRSENVLEKSIDDSHLERIGRLEQALTQAQFAKAAIEAHLQNAHEAHSRLAASSSASIAEAEAKRSQLVKLISIYQQKIKQQEEIIQNYEKRPHDFPHHNEQDEDDVTSNFEQLFQKQNISKWKRQHSLKLLEKTGDYIKKLKSIIKQKDKKIKILEKRIGQMRNVAHHLQRGNSLTMNTDADEEVYEEDADIPDNYSEKMENRRPDNWRRLRQLQNQKQLVTQQYNLLQCQVESLQDELLRAEQQQTGLVRMKEIYKEEIGKLRQLCEQKDVEIVRMQRIIDQYANYRQ